MEKIKKILLSFGIMLIVLACVGCGENKCDNCGEEKNLHRYECAPHIFGTGTLEYETKFFCDECASKLYRSNTYADMKDKTGADGFWIVFTLAMAVVGFVCGGSYWGNKVNEVVHSKGYDQDWYWRGFWLGEFAFREAVAMPQRHGGSESKLLRTAKSSETEVKYKNGWKCDKCGCVNPEYTGTCSCGNSKFRRSNDVEKATNKEGKDELKEELNNVELIKKYKELLDSGAITQEEFDKKKSEILN